MAWTDKLCQKPLQRVLAHTVAVPRTAYFVMAGRGRGLCKANTSVW